MRARVNRRAALRTAADSALLASVLLGLPMGQAVATAIIAPPAGGYLLSRCLKRELKGGAAIEVKRVWKVDFDLEPRGFVVNGDQLSAQVSAPASLAPLADIERRRRADAMFPLLLDKTGMIVRSGDSASDSALLDAISTARQVFASVLARQSAGDIVQFMAQIGQTSADTVSRVPKDLFYPRAGPREVTREIILIDGTKGEIEVATTADVDDNGLMQRCSRSVTTRIGPSSRGTFETWELAKQA